MWCVVWDVVCSVRCGVCLVSPLLSHIVRSLTQSECAEFPGPVSPPRPPAVYTTAVLHHANANCSYKTGYMDTWCNVHNSTVCTVHCAVAIATFKHASVVDTGQEVTDGLHSRWRVVCECEWWWLMVVSGDMLQEVRLQLPDLAWSRLRRTMRYLTTDNTLRHHGQHSLTVTHLKSILGQTVRAASVWPRRPCPRSVNVVVARWLQLAPPRPAVQLRCVVPARLSACQLSAVTTLDTSQSGSDRVRGSTAAGPSTTDWYQAPAVSIRHQDSPLQVWEDHPAPVHVCRRVLPHHARRWPVRTTTGSGLRHGPQKADCPQEVWQSRGSRPFQTCAKWWRFDFDIFFLSFYLFPYRICHMKNSFLFVLGWKLGTMSKFWLCWIGKVWKYLDQLSSRLTDLTFKTSISSALADITFDGWAFSSVWTSFILVPARQAAVSRVNKIKFRFAVFSLI